jgi:adenylate cyclase
LFASDLGFWLANAADRHRDMADLHRAFCDRLLDEGLPISRSSLGLEVLHPELSGWQFVWASREVQVLDSQRGIGTSTDYLTSPVRVVDETWSAYRRRLNEPAPDMPLLENLRWGGATDYVIFPLPFLDRHRSAFVSFTTQVETGFSEAELVSLETAARLLGPWMERQVLRRIAVDLLNTYVGRRSGERVFNGAIERGSADIVRAAIWMADLRGFTRYSDTQPLETVLARLNRFFETLVAAIEVQRGEVLKFIGDGLLAIFPGERENLRVSCRAAAEAARAACAGMANLNEEQASANDPLRFGLALHAGELAYGNIGGRTRLDFTVIGPAVNHTSRLLEVSKTLGRQVVISGTFAQARGLNLPSLGTHRVRDVADLQEIFGLPEEAA